MNTNKFTRRITEMYHRLKTMYMPPRLVFWILGIGTSIWFLMRVIPKPQRAGYPCMKAAAPIMSGFILYILSLGGATLLFRKAVRKFKTANYLAAGVAICFSIILSIVFFVTDVKTIYANVLGITWEKGVLPDAPNSPMGTPWGINPGRVAWAWNPASTRDECTNTITDAYFMKKNTNQASINSMADKAIKAIGGKPTVKDSWDAIFNSFNERKSGTAKSYTAGEKIFIKINNGQAGWAINRTTLAETGTTSAGTGKRNIAMSNTSPQAVLAFLRQLIDSCGIAQTDIIIGEPMTHVYKSMADIVWPVYPDVIIIDKEREDLGRTKSTGWKSGAIKYSDKGTVMSSAITDNLMNELYDAHYMINIAALKAHARGGVTFCAKNHFGSHGSHNGKFDSFHLHAGLISVADNDRLEPADNPRIEYGMYRVLTDLMGHEKLGRNTVLFVVDGLWGGIEATDMPVKWQTAPFNNDWPSSLFVAQDQIALESVCLDFLRAEAEVNNYFFNRPFFPAVDDHLHQGADKSNWPADFIYDPEGDGTEIPSLGVHEHWNNSTNKQYSRNLSAEGKGIELYTINDTVTINPNPSTSVKSVVLAESFKVWPSPVVSSAEVSFKIKSQAQVSLYLINLDGKIVKQIANKKLSAGQYHEDFNIDGLNSGSYILVLSANNSISTQKILVK